MSLNLLVTLKRVPNIIKLKRFILSLLLLLPLLAEAQMAQLQNLYLDRSQQDHHEFGITMGVANYYGDLQPKLFPHYGYMPMIGVVYKYFMNPHIGMRFGASFTRLTAADSLSNIPQDVARNLSFTTNLFEVHGALEYNFWSVDILKHRVSPYIFGGISVFYFNPYADDSNGHKVFLRPLGTEGEGLPMYPDRREYSLVNIAFPFGAGLKFFVGNKIFVTAELGFRYTNTGYLDDVNKTYVNLDTLGKYKGSLAAEMAYRGNELKHVKDPYDPSNHNYVYPYPDYGATRGNPSSNDWYWFGNITCTVYLRAIGGTKEYLKTKCPVFFGRWW